MNQTQTLIGLLDGFSVRTLDGDLSRPEIPQSAQRLVAYVGLGRRVGRTTTAGTLWPDLSELNAHSSLRTTLWRLHKAWPGLVEPAGASLQLADGVSVDVHELVSWARAVLEPSAAPPGQLPQVALRGELLPGWYDDWVLMEREQLRQLRMHALEVLADTMASVHRFGEAMQAALAAVQAEPLRESASRAVIRVHLAEGNVAEAIRTYNAFSALVDAELGVAPSPHMDELMKGFRRRDRRASQARPAPQPGRARPLPAPDNTSQPVIAMPTPPSR